MEFGTVKIGMQVVVARLGDSCELRVMADGQSLNARRWGARGVVARSAEFFAVRQLFNFGIYWVNQGGADGFVPYSFKELEPAPNRIKQWFLVQHNRLRRTARSLRGDPVSEASEDLERVGSRSGILTLSAH